ncbi:MAG: hypothetical protein GF313_02965 [Caldithrix sp.]|nr:hypothetical protein [Caldithrix sp.]
MKENYNILLPARIGNDRARSRFLLTEKPAAGDELVLLGNQENLNRFIEDYPLHVMYAGNDGSCFCRMVTPGWSL